MQEQARTNYNGEPGASAPGWSSQSDYRRHFEQPRAHARGSSELPLRSKNKRFFLQPASRRR